MLDNPLTRFVIRAGLGGVAAAVPLWVVDKGWKEVVGAGILAALTFAGITAGTPVDKSVGVGKEV